MSRSRKSSHHTAAVYAYLTPSEADALRREADDEGLSTSSFLRRLIRKQVLTRAGGAAGDRSAA